MNIVPESEGSTVLTANESRTGSSANARELERIHKESVKLVRPEEETGAIKSRYAILQQMGTMMKSAKKSVKLITTDSGLHEIGKHHGKLIQDISKKGIEVKIIAPISKANEPSAKELSNHAEIRNINDVEQSVRF